MHEAQDELQWKVHFQLVTYLLQLLSAFPSWNSLAGGSALI